MASIDKVIPVLDTRKVLVEHLTAKAAPQFTTKCRAVEAALEISEKLQNQDIIRLLEDDDKLIKAVSNSYWYRQEKEELGEELYCKVSEIEPDLSSKITGMLLELDNQTIRQLFENEDLFVKAVKKSREEYLIYEEESHVKESLGEELYSRICAHYAPDVASHLTGMLLELRSEDLKILLVDQAELEAKLRLAYDTNPSRFNLTCARMATHQDLADFIKKVHIDLRLSCRQDGAETAWENHCRNSELLKKYAAAMQHLATSFWEKNNAQDPNLNRIYWVVKECDDFYTGGQWKAVEKEQKLYKRYFGEELTAECDAVNFPLSVLDVGSCYNPFKKFDIFNVTAIDIAPATDDVKKCDFIAASVVDYEYLNAGSYDVVLFSFLLEYLPHPKMRFDSCRKAYELLKPGGILIILTPDSKHDSANAGIMKSWRQGLASIGFLRINFQKLKHLRCMTFYKCLDPRTPTEWLNGEKVTISVENSIVIPQDLNPYSELNEEPLEERSEEDNSVLVRTFAGLAGTEIYSD